MRTATPNPTTTTSPIATPVGDRLAALVIRVEEPLRLTLDNAGNRPYSTAPSPRTTAHETTSGATVLGIPPNQQNKTIGPSKRLLSVTFLLTRHIAA